MRHNHELFSVDMAKSMKGMAKARITFDIDLGKASPTAKGRAAQAIKSGVCKYSAQSQTGVIYKIVSALVRMPTAFMTTTGKSGWRNGVHLQVYGYNTELHDQLALYQVMTAKDNSNEWSWRNFKGQRSNSVLNWWTCEVPYQNVMEAIAQHRPVPEEKIEQALQLLETNRVITTTFNIEDDDNA